MTRNTTSLRSLLSVCGCAAAISLAGPAHAQSDPRDPARPETVSTPATSRDGRVPSVLNRLEGTWRVVVEVNPGLWGRVRGHRDIVDHTTPGASGTDADQTDIDDQADNADGVDADDGRRAVQPQRTDASRVQPIDAPGAHEMRGVAQTALILDGEILQERMLFIDASGALNPDHQAEPVNPDAQTGAPSPDGDAAPSRSYSATQCLAFFSFDEETETYTVVLMNSRDGEIFHETGAYDATSNRIVFGAESQPDAHTDAQPGRGADEDRRRTPSAARPVAPDRAGGLRVVLEVIDDDSHRVTMYAGGPGPGAPRPVTPATDARTDRARPDAPRTTDAAAPGLDANIVYRATYTRAGEDQIDTYRRILDSAGAGVPGTPSQLTRARD